MLNTNKIKKKWKRRQQWRGTSGESVRKVQIEREIGGRRMKNSTISILKAALQVPATTTVATWGSRGRKVRERNTHSPVNGKNRLDSKKGLGWMRMYLAQSKNMKMLKTECFSNQKSLTLPTQTTQRRYPSWITWSTSRRFTARSASQPRTKTTYSEWFTSRSGRKSSTWFKRGKRWATRWKLYSPTLTSCGLTSSLNSLASWCALGFKNCPRET